MSKGGGCCIGDCGFCCIADCGFCCIFDSCSDSGCSYSPPSRSTTVAQAKRAAEQLAELKERAGENASKAEAEVVNEINVTIVRFIEMLRNENEKVYGGKKLNINIELIEQKNEAMKNRVVGFIGNRLNERLNEQDPELSVIMDNPNEANRKKAFDSFYERVYRDAMRDLISVIEDAMREQSLEITREIENRLGEVNAGMNEITEEYKEVRRMKAEDDDRLAAKQLDCMYEITLCDLLLDELKETH